MKKEASMRQDKWIRMNRSIIQISISLQDHPEILEFQTQSSQMTLLGWIKEAVEELQKKQTKKTLRLSLTNEPDADHLCGHFDDITKLYSRFRAIVK